MCGLVFREFHTVRNIRICKILYLTVYEKFSLDVQSCILNFKEGGNRRECPVNVKAALEENNSLIVSRRGSKGFTGGTF